METTIFETPSKQQIKYSDYTHGTSALHYDINKIERGHKTFMKHLHSEYEIVYLIDHYLDFYVNEEVYHLLPGQALFIDRDIMHGHADVNGNYGSYISFHFGENFIFPDSKSHIYNQYFSPLASGAYTFTKHISGGTSYENQILNIVSRLALLSDHIAANALSIQICLLQIFDIMSRENAFDINQISGQQKNLIKVATCYMNQNYASPLLIREVSARLNLSPDYFSKLFKKATGITPKNYIQSLRIDHAIQEIDTHPDCSLTEVALKTGFSDSNYFARAFKNKMGISPTAYKQQKE